jgi:excisionase family DNA binding protein
MNQMSLSIEEVCAATGLGRTKLYEHINSGKLKARKLGKRTLILKVDLENFLTNLDTYTLQKAEG